MSSQRGSTPGRPREVEDREILNVLRRSQNEEVLFNDILEAEEITIGRSGLSKRINKLESKRRVKSRTVGNTRLYSLGEFEVTEPVRDTQLERTHRWGNLAIDVGKTLAVWSFTLLVPAMVFFIMFLHGNAGQFSPPFLTLDSILLVGYLLGYLGTGFALGAGLAWGVGRLLPLVTLWRMGSFSE